MLFRVYHTVPNIVSLVLLAILPVLSIFFRPACVRGCRRGDSLLQGLKRSSRRFLIGARWSFIVDRPRWEEKVATLVVGLSDAPAALHRPRSAGRPAHTLMPAATPAALSQPFRGQHYFRIPVRTDPKVVPSTRYFACEQNTSKCLPGSTSN